MGRRAGRRTVAALVLLAATGCGDASASGGSPDPVAPTSTSTSTTSTSTTTTLPPTTTTAPPPPADRPVHDPLGSAFARIGDLYLTHPSARVERVGFHQSADDGAQALEPVASAVPQSTLRTRARSTGDRTAADVVVQPGTTVLAPVSGTVLKAEGYRLYCAYDDETVVIEPDDRPGWWVVVLHVEGVQVTAGQRVEAGATPIAVQARRLPFPSQVDRLASTAPPWPHVHVEVDDPAVPDTPSKGDSC